MGLSHTMIRMKSVFSVSLFTRFYCITKALKPTKELKLSVNPYIGFPSVAAILKPNADEAGLISGGNGKVSTVLLMGDFPQVANSVVRPVPVDVVNFTLGGCAVNPLPYNPVRRDMLISKPANFVSVAIRGRNRGPSSVSRIECPAFLLCGPNAALKIFWECVIPCQRASYRAIIEKLSNSVRVHCCLLWLTLKRNTYNGGVQYVR